MCGWLKVGYAVDGRLGEGSVVVWMMAVRVVIVWVMAMQCG